MKTLVSSASHCHSNFLVGANHNLHPRNQTWIPKIAMFKGSYLFQGPSFWVSMLVFGVYINCKIPIVEIELEIPPGSFSTLLKALLEGA